MLFRNHKLFRKLQKSVEIWIKKQANSNVFKFSITNVVRNLGTVLKTPKINCSLNKKSNTFCCSFTFF